MDTFNYMKCSRSAASAFNPVDKEALERVRHSIATQGYLKEFPVVVEFAPKLGHYVVIDGWHRVLACRELKIDPSWITLPEGSTAEQYSATANLYRRQIGQTKLAFAIFRQPKYAHLKRDERIKLLMNLGFKSNTARNAVLLIENTPAKLRGRFIDGDATLNRVKEVALEKKQALGRPAIASWRERGEIAAFVQSAAKKQDLTVQELVHKLVVEHCKSIGYPINE